MSRPNPADSTIEVQLKDLCEASLTSIGVDAEPADRVSCERFEVRLGPCSDSNFYVGFEPRIGLFIATHRSLPLGATVDVRIHFPTGQSIASEGYVHWRRDAASSDLLTQGPEPGLGIRLDHLSPRARRLTKAFMSQREPLFFPEH